MAAAAQDPMEVTDGSNELNLTKESRMLYVLGKETLLALKNSSVLILGLRGLGVEVAKNVILAGVKSVALLDDELVEARDLSAQFYLSEADIGKPRAESCFAKLVELNRSVHVTLLKGAVDTATITQYKVVVNTNTTSYNEWLRLAQLCRSHKVHFVSADIFGLVGRAFVDFGEGFTVTDTNGEQPQTSHVGYISSDNPGVVRTLEEQRHGLETGNYVRFREVEGMTELNNMPPVEVRVTGPYTFTICDTTQFTPYAAGGLIEEVKMPVTVNFEPLERSMWKPEYLPSDFAKMDRQDQFHLGGIAIAKFYDAHGHLPRFHHDGDAAEVLSIAQQLNAEHKLVTKGDEPDELNAALITGLAKTARASISPMAAFMGGIIGQEVMKACSGKFMPIRQWFYFDALECLPKYEEGAPADDFVLNGSRYDDQIAVFGRTFHQRLTDLKVFTVGAGAIGCELLKNHALMGLGTSDRGHLFVTDMDTIEVSNLNRQFLFRDKDVQQLKSETAARAVKHMNPDIHIKSYMDKVGPETEETFDDEFWESVDVVCNALDNVQARMYVDDRCRYYARPLLESGTLGTKGNVQVVVPFLTETYSSSRDPPEKETPMCTIKNFPYQIDHTIHWSRDLFAGLFTTSAEEVNSYINNPDYLQELMKQPSRLQTLEVLHDCLVTHRPKTFADCVAWARLKFEELYNHTIQQLLFGFPPDMITTSGAKFWSGTKRVPTPAQFDINNPLHMEFVRAAANLRAQNFGIAGTSTTDGNMAPFVEVLKSVHVPPFAPKREAKPASETEDVPDAPASATPDEEAVARLVASLPPAAQLQGFRMTPIEFEKDDDSNWHVQFMTASSNCRAANYSIPLADLHETRRIAGRIIPAIVTTTAMVTGLVCLELYKVIQRKPITDYKNAFANLALPFFGFSEPIAAPKRKEGEYEFSLWDFVDVREGRDLTVQEFIDWFKTKFEWDVSMISSGVSVIYLQWWPPAKRTERLGAKLAQTVMSISKQKFSPKSKTLMLQVCCEDKTGTEREIPDVRYFFR